MSYTPTDYLPYAFANRRHIGPSPHEMEEMLEVVGAPDLEALIAQTVPAGIRAAGMIGTGKAMSEHGLLHHMRQIGAQNRVMTSLIGQGFHGTVTPPAILRNIFENRLGTRLTPRISPRSRKGGLRRF